MDSQICIDTSVAIEWLKKRKFAETFAELHGDSRVTLSVVSLFELLLRKTKLEDVESFRKDVELLEVNESVARTASILHKELERKGRMIEFADIFIAACAMTNGCSLATLNKKHFENIPGLKLVDI
ncbi:MAG: type II toxin-antitoxin system VapC family toxin [Candidatus Woesearchaeota archaeon]